MTSYSLLASTLWARSWFTLGIRQGTPSTVSVGTAVVDADHVREGPVVSMVQEVGTHHASGLVRIEGIPIWPIATHLNGLEFHNKTSVVGILQD